MGVSCQANFAPPPPPMMPAGAAPSGAGDGGAYDLSQWMGEEDSITCQVRGVKGSASLEAAREAAESFAEDAACTDPSWLIEFIPMSKPAFAKWLSKSKEWRGSLTNGEAALAHSAADGAFVALGGEYIGGADELGAEIKSRRQEWAALKSRQSKTQCRRFLMALLAVTFVILGCYLYVQYSIQQGSSADHWREKLVEFYRIHNPAKLEGDDKHITQLLGKYRGRESRLMAQLKQKYAPDGGEL